MVFVLNGVINNYAAPTYTYTFILIFILIILHLNLMTQMLPKYSFKETIIFNTILLLAIVNHTSSYTEPNKRLMRQTWP